MSTEMEKIFVRHGVCRQIAIDLHKSYTQVNRVLNGYRAYSNEEVDEQIRRYAIEHYGGVSSLQNNH